MGLFGFIKDVGANVFGGGSETDAAGEYKSLAQHVRDNEINADNLDFKMTGGRVVVSGYVNSQEEKEKVILILGNVKGVAEVEDQIRVGAPPAVEEAAPAEAAAPAATTSSATEGGEATPDDWQSDTYTVVSGDTLGGISKKVYGKASKYMVIFNANTPMLKDPNKIYPGQVLRIPPLED